MPPPTSSTPRTPTGRQGRRREEALLSGFGTDNYQARVNSLEYGLDGWVYGSCGLFGGKIKSFERRRTRSRQPRFPHQARHGRNRAGHRANAAGPGARRLGQLVRLRQHESRLALSAGRSLPPPQPARGPDCHFESGVRRAGSEPRLPGHEGLATLSSCPARRAGRRPPAASASTATICWAANIRAISSPASRSTCSCTGMMLTPSGSTFAGRRADGEEAARVPRLDRSVVPPGADAHRAGRLPVGRGHVPLRDRAPALDSAGRIGEGRCASGQHAGPHLSESGRRTASRGQMPRLDRIVGGRSGRGARHGERPGARPGDADGGLAGRIGDDRVGKTAQERTTGDTIARVGNS